MMTQKRSSKNVLSLFRAEEQWRVLPIAFVMCAAETILVGINLVGASDVGSGVALLVLGSAVAAFGIALLFSSEDID